MRPQNKTGKNTEGHGVKRTHSALERQPVSLVTKSLVKMLLAHNGVFGLNIRFQLRLLNLASCRSWEVEVTALRNWVPATHVGHLN